MPITKALNRLAMRIGYMCLSRPNATHLVIYDGHEYTIKVSKHKSSEELRGTDYSCILIDETVDSRAAVEEPKEGRFWRQAELAQKSIDERPQWMKDAIGIAPKGKSIAEEPLFEAQHRAYVNYLSGSTN
jgi:hypothetical protein